MKKVIIRNLTSLFLVLVMVVAMMAQSGCGEKPAETTKAPATEAPTTEAPATEAPATEAPATEAPETEAPATEAPETEAPATDAPATEAPETEAPETEAPATEAPATGAPETEAPVTESPETEAPETEEPETEAPKTEFNISYDLDGGIDGGNPTVYNNTEDLELIVPVRVGYDFLGWIGSGLDAATVNVTIPKGTEGDLSFKATWQESASEIDPSQIDKTHFGKDDGVGENPDGSPISTHDHVGARGEGVYVVKTVYTDIKSDAVKDAAYSYGVHWYGNIPHNAAYYEDRETGYDIYMIHGQDGMLHVFIEVTDPDVVVNGTLWNYKTFHNDSMDIYVDIGNLGFTSRIIGLVADPTHTYKYSATGVRVIAEEWEVALTDKGYNMEFALSSNGMPFTEHEEIGLGFYLNDANEYESLESYRKSTLRNPTLLFDETYGYRAPNAEEHDAVRISMQSATGNPEITVESVDKTGDMFTDILSGAASVAVITDENAPAEVVKASQNLLRIVRACGAAASMRSRETMDGEAFDYEIILGVSSRRESANAMKLIGYNEAGVYVENNKIVIIGWSELGISYAYDIACALIKTAAGGAKLGNGQRLYKMTVPGMVGGDVPMLEGFDAVTDVGEGAIQIYKLDASAEEYGAYLALLEEAGYEKYTENTMATVLCATYVKDGTVINTQYGGETDRSIRIVAEPLSNTALPSLEIPEDADSNVSVSSITLMAPHNLCLVIQLSNGNFVIVDSGINGTQKELSDFLRDKAPNDRPVVEAWIMTHFHCDHIGGFIDYVGSSSLLRYITIESIIYNFPQKMLLDTAPGSTDINNISHWYNTRIPRLIEKGATVYQARTGQKYYFGNAEIEILWTYEDITPFNIFVDRTNPTCIGFSIEIAGQKIMVTGDSSGEEFTMAYKKYGEYLKSDFVQLSHHGGGDGVSPIEFYDLVGAPYVLNPGDGVWYGDAERETAENAEKLFVRDHLGICTIPLPYAGGEFESEKGQ